MPTTKTPTINQSLNARFIGRVAVVTAGASGIGAAAARRLHAEGGSVVVGDINPEGIDRLGKEFGDRFLGMRCDATQERDVERLMEAAIDQFGCLDVACCVAGGGGHSRILETDEASWRHGIELTLTSTFFAVKHSARQMINANHGGAIVAVSSICAQIPQSAGYSSAKAGVEMLTKVAALELGEHGIRVNAVAPGRTATPATEKWDLVVGPAWKNQTPLGRIGSPEEIAAAIAFLASDDAAFISGASLSVDGGFSTSTFSHVYPQVAHRPATGTHRSSP